MSERDEANPDAPEYRKALAAFEPSTRRIVPIFARWKCAEWCCPDREPQEHALQPTCYTCGKPMGRVP
jgi:hypothetical protein